MLHWSIAYHYTYAALAYSLSVYYAALVYSLSLYYAVLAPAFPLQILEN